jgi:DNA mismatch endonuclease, patch repair protein
MKGNRGKRTELERRVRRLLLQAGLRGYRLNDPRLPGRPDFAYRMERVAVFAHGCFWHRHDSHLWPPIKSNEDYWSAKAARNVERDRRKQAELRSLGWRVLVLWECQISDRPRACVLKVARALQRELVPA